jgi:uncharacterized membrane protein YgcG
MCVMLQARGLWHIVKDESEDYIEDHMALEVIAKVVLLEMLSSIVSKPTTKVAWESVTLHNVGVDRVRKSKVSLLKREFGVLMFHDSESVDDFNVRIRWIMNQLAVLGYEYKEEEVVRWFLLVLPHKFEPAPIETLWDVEFMMIDELIGCLKPSEEGINCNGRNTVASLNLTDDELVAHVSSHLKVLGNGGPDRMKEASSSNGKRGSGHGKGHGSSGRGGNRGRGDTGNHGGGSTGHGGPDDVMKDECWYYGKHGH